MSRKKSAFIKDYKAIDTKVDYGIVMEKHCASLQYDERYGTWEVFIPSNGKTQAIMFEIDPEDISGYETED